MANFNELFKDEVRRLARKEIKGTLEVLQRENVQLRRNLSQLKKQVAALESRQGRGLRGAATATGARNSAEGGEDDGGEGNIGRLRVSGKAIRKMREKLGLTQAEFARLLGVSGQSVYQWERKDGQLQLRSATKKAVIEARGWGVRDARRRLEELNAQ